jgi:hypothetical protein
MDENLEESMREQIENTFSPDCVRKKSNWSVSSNLYKFDHPDFSPETLLKDIPDHSPKLQALLTKIETLDRRDTKKYGRKFKHFIFTDLKSGTYGAKLLAGALMAKGMHMGYVAPANTTKGKKKFGKIELDTNAKLAQSRGNNFLLLSSTSVYDQPISTVLKKDMLALFNRRPENVYGELARIIILDSGYKEGIDLFDIKYIHIFEPSVVGADQKQAIGRGTRTCGQKGLDFHPTRGWPLYVFVYDIEFSHALESSFLGTQRGIELYLKAMNMDIRRFRFSNELEKTTVIGSVDYELNLPIHSFSIPDIDDIDETEDGDDDIEFIYGGMPHGVGNFEMGGAVQENLMIAGGPKRKFVIRGEKVLSHSALPDVEPRKSFEHMRRHIREHFGEFAWPTAKMENLCAEKKVGGSSSQLIQYTPTQDFIRHYFTPTNPCKGMLLYHGTGVGKTCSAIAAATSSFEKEGYTILWVTRTTLKNDIWKNMFDQICNESIRGAIENQGLVVPADQKKRMRLLSKSWRIRPMSYKQFSNLVSKQNAFYKSLVKQNGELDPLRKTLLIIDEAHKLYGGGDLSSIERPDMAALHAALMNSYSVSGRDSVRLLLMTATPITQDPMELIQLINLAKSADQQMPATFDRFADAYLTESGEFTERGRATYLDDIAGYVSYLNREKDARQFSQPIIEHVHVPIVNGVENAKRFDKRIVREFLETEAADLQGQIIENQKKLEGELGDVDASKFLFLKDEFCGDLEGKSQKQCERVVKANIKQLVAEAKAEVKSIRAGIQEIRAAIKARNATRKDAIDAVKKNIEEYQADYDTYKGTALYQLRNKCATRIKTPSELYHKMQTEDPDLAQYNQDIETYNQKINELHDQLKTDLVAYKVRMDKLKKILKQDLSEIERNVIKMTVVEEQQTRKRLAKLKKKTIREAEKQIRGEIKQMETKKRRRFQKLRSTAKKLVAQDKRDKKKAVREERKLKRTLRKQGELQEEIQHEGLKALVDTYSQKIENELAGNQMAQQEKEQAKLAKVAAKAEEKEREKLAKAAAKAVEKAAKAAAKEQLRQTKKLEKEHAKAAAKATRKNNKA